MSNPYCGGCGKSVRTGGRLATYDGFLWHSMCAIQAAAPAPIYHDTKVRLN